MAILLGMFAGIAGGYLLRRQVRLLRVAEIATSVLVYLLLFLLGVSVGGNETVLSALDELGLQALLLSVAGIAGSILATAPLGGRLFGRSADNEE